MHAATKHLLSTANNFSASYQLCLIYNTHAAVTVLHIGIKYYILHEVQVAHVVVQISRIFEQHARYLAKTDTRYVSVMRLSKKCRSRTDKKATIKIVL